MQNKHHRREILEFQKFQTNTLFSNPKQSQHKMKINKITFIWKTSGAPFKLLLEDWKEFGLVETNSTTKKNKCLHFRRRTEQKKNLHYTR